MNKVIKRIIVATLLSLLIAFVFHLAGLRGFLGGYILGFMVAIINYLIQAHE